MTRYRSSRKNFIDRVKFAPAAYKIIQTLCTGIIKNFWDTTHSSTLISVIAFLALRSFKITPYSNFKKIYQNFSLTDLPKDVTPDPATLI